MNGSLANSIPQGFLGGGKWEVVSALSRDQWVAEYHAVQTIHKEKREFLLRIFKTAGTPLASGTDRQRIISQAKALATVKHPNIAGIVAFEEQDDGMIVAEEFISPVTMSEKMNRYDLGRNNPDAIASTSCEFGLALARGLESIHKLGFGCGGLTPNRIRFRSADWSQPVISWFGDSQAISFGSSNTVEMWQKSLPFLPPECFGYAGTANPFSTDLYSIGALLFQVATGRSPVQGDSVKKLLAGICSQVPALLSEEIPQFSQQLSLIVARLLRKSPQVRYQTARGLTGDLERCFSCLAGHEPIPVFAMGRQDSFRELNNGVQLVGRREELGKIQKAIETATSISAQFVTIGARSGIGKSRLASETLRQTEAFGMPVFSTKYSKFERNVPLSGFLRVLEKHSAWLRNQDPIQLVRWQEDLLGELSQWGKLLLKRVPFYDTLLPEFPALPSNLRLDEEEEFFTETFAKFILALAPDEKPYVLFFDDIQWADDLSLRVFNTLTKLLESNHNSRGAFILATFRSEEVDEDDFLHHSVLTAIPERNYISLGPLSRPECDEFVKFLLDEEDTDVSKIQTIAFQLTEGNPLHILEFTGAVIKSGAFYRDQDSERWLIDEKKLSATEIDGSVHDLLNKRLKTLSPQALDIMTTISAVGSVITRHALGLILEKKMSRLGSQAIQWLPPGIEVLEKAIDILLDELAREHLVVLSSGNVSILHDRIRESAYPLISDEDRRSLHQDFGEFVGKTNLEYSENSKSKEFFEAGFHILRGRPELNPELSRQILFKAGQHSMNVFSYAHAEEFLAAASKLLHSDPSQFQQNSPEIKEWLDVRELHADAQALAEKIQESVDGYREILRWCSDKFRSALIQSKLSHSCFQLFQYSASMEAGINGLRIVGESFPRSQTLALLSLLFSIPVLLVTIVWYRFFAQPDKVVSTSEEEIRWQLRVNIVLPVFFIRPAFALAHMVPLTRRALAYKPNSNTATLFAYWGAIIAVFGFSRASQACHRRAQAYFNRHPSPVMELFITFTSAYLHDFPMGELEIAGEKLQQAARSAISVGDSFWRMTSWQGLNHVADYGSGSKQTVTIVHNLMEFHRKTNWDAPFSISSIRYLLFHERVEEAIDIVESAKAYGLESSRLNYESIDAIMCVTEAAQFHLLRDEPQEALPLLELGFGMTLRHLQRTSFCSLTPVLLAQARIRCGHRIRAIVPLSVAWFNAFTGVRIFRPQTIFATAELLAQFGFRRSAMRSMHAAINTARKNGWKNVVAELQLMTAESLVSVDPQQAISLLSIAIEYFVNSGNVFFYERCKKSLSLAKNNYYLKYPKMVDELGSEPLLKSNSVGSTIRRKLDQSAIMEMLAKLSVLSDIESLLDIILDTFCTCTGANVGFVMMKTKDSWELKRCRNITFESNLELSAPSKLFDLEFIERAKKGSGHQPLIRERKVGKGNKGDNLGSSMAIPLSQQSETLCLVFLGNEQLPDLFTEETISVLAPIVNQASIAIHNIRLMQGREEQLRMESDLATAKAVQSSILPFSILPENTRVASHYEPAGKTGGDWYGYYYAAHQGVVYLFIGDATGHGIGSALVAGLMSGTIYGCLFLDENDARRSALDPVINVPDKLLHLSDACNAALFSTGARSNVLMTMFYLAIDVTNGKCWATSAGHTHPFLRQKNESGTHVSAIATSGTRVGFLPPREHKAKIHEFTLSPGDVIFLYTDGLVENPDSKGKTLSMRKIREIIARSEGPDVLVASLEQAGAKLRNGQELLDDVTMLAFQWLGPQSVRL